MTSEASQSGRRILFLLRNLYYLRNFEAPIRALTARGHVIVVLHDGDDDLSNEVAAQFATLQRDLGDRLESGTSHGRRDFRRAFAEELQCARDILFYHHPRYRNAALARERVVKKAHPLARWLFARRRYEDQAKAQSADAMLARFSRSLPPDEAIRDRLAALAVDLVIVSPLIDIGSTQLEWVRAAEAMGIPSILAVASWDNLTNKSRLQVETDRVIVWNDIQRREAIEYHGVDRATIVVTGAQLFDHWFERRPSRDREAFCRRLGLDPAEALILYVASSRSIAGDEEVDLVTRWLERLRACASPLLAKANVLVRPHPLNTEPFEGFDPSRFGNVAVHPCSGGFPVTDVAQADYFDALYHCGALVGLNTSALVEASILRKRCFTILDPAFRRGQDGTFHFRHLTDGGILRQSDSFDEHFAQLEQELTAPEGAGRADLDQFTRSFLRPHGLDQKANPRFVAAVEDLLAQPAPRPARPSPAAASRLVRDLTAIAVFFISHPLRRWTRAHRIWQ